MNSSAPRLLNSPRAHRRIASFLILVMLHGTIAPSIVARTMAPVRELPFTIGSGSIDLADRTGSDDPLCSAAPDFCEDEEDGGPSMPEAAGFEAVSGDELVDLFSGDFRYSLPLLAVGDHPITLTYNANVGANDEASWTGLGWNLNTGAVTRDVRGLPDDLMGDEVVQETHMKPREELELGVGVGLQFAGVDALKNLGLGLNLGIAHDNYEGWGLKVGLKGSAGFGSDALSGSLGLTAGIDSRSGGFLNPNVGMDAKATQGQRSTSVGAFVGFDIGSREGYKQTNFGFQVRREFEHHYRSHGHHHEQGIEGTGGSISSRSAMPRLHT